MGIKVDVPAGVVESVEFISANDEMSFTRNEGLVLKTLRNSKTPVKAYDLLSELKQFGLRAPMSIYRALDGLTAKGFVKRIEMLNAYVASKVGQSAASAFVICRKCSQVKEIMLEESQIAALFPASVVSPENIRIEAMGECEDVCGSLCANAS